MFQKLITCLTAWYIPPEWLKPSDPPPRNILEAAQLAQRLASEGSRHIPYSKIPLIIHQTWKDTDLVTWKPEVLEGVEKWLTYATAAGKESMAYFLWLDEGCKQLITGLQPDLVEYVGCVALDGGEVGHLPSVDGATYWWSGKYPTCDNSKAWF